MKLEEVNTRTKEAVDFLVAALESGHSEVLTAYLGAMAKFHTYSFGNIMLIARQKPDATNVAGLRTWNSLGRFVKRGEKGIFILAPMVGRRSTKDTATDEPSEDATTEGQRTLYGFRAVYVFDINQTEGKELPTLTEVNGDVSGYRERLFKFVEAQTVELSFSERIAPAKGLSHGGKITLLSGMQPAEEFSTLVHEIAHEMLHRGDRRTLTTKQVRETEAEAVAFVVCQSVGLQNGTASQDYIQLWHGDTPRLDTISYYDDAEPNWNERPYFTRVEEKRGRSGCHVNVSPRDPETISETERSPESAHSRFVPTPGYDGRTSSQMRMCMVSQGNRVVLSGIGGDEVMGGAPTAAPELENLLARAQVGALAHQLKVWALEKRKPWFHLFWEAARGFFPPALVGVPKYMRPAPWLQCRFVKRNWVALTGYPSRTKLFGPLPSFQENLSTLDALRRQLARTALPFEPPFEKRYPYLDRGLLEFMFAIPREQLVRPTQRRSLMRRALAGIVPDEILNRKTKAFVARAPMVNPLAESP